MIMNFLKIVLAFILGASYSDASEKAKVIAKNDHYVSYENGVVYDKKVKIEWLAGPDKNVTWDEAKAWERRPVGWGGRMADANKRGIEISL